MALALCSLISPPTAPATPADRRIEEARARAAEARLRLDDLASDLEERTEDYLEADSALAETRSRIAENEVDLSRALGELDRAERILNARVSAIYRGGTVDLFAVFLGITDFKDLVTRLDLLRRVGRQDAEIVANVREAKARIEEMRSGLERRRAEQVVLRNRARDAQGRMSSAVSAQKNYLAELNGEVKRLIAEEKRREAAEARARAAEAARLAAVEDSGAPGRVFDPQALGTPRPEVLSVARRFLGKTPYVWGGTTPAGFDCSGLVLYSYRELGIALPRTSRQQYLVGAFIPRHRLDLLEPGDLVFFGREGDATRVHHVALYSGGGLMIHAPQAGEYVSETSLLDRIATRRDYVGAVRP